MESGGLRWYNRDRRKRIWLIFSHMWKVNTFEDREKKLVRDGKTRNRITLHTHENVINLLCANQKLMIYRNFIDLVNINFSLFVILFVNIF